MSKEDEMACAKLGPTGLLEFEVKDSDGSTYLHQFNLDIHLALTKAMVKSVLYRVKDRRGRIGRRRMVQAIENITVDDLVNFEPEDDS